MIAFILMTQGKGPKIDGPQGPPANVKDLEVPLCSDGDGHDDVEGAAAAATAATEERAVDKGGAGSEGTDEGFGAR